MITWSNCTTTGEPRSNFPKRLERYHVDVYTFGDTLWNVTLWTVDITTRKYSIITDHFKTQDEAYEFLDGVVNLLELKYPNAVCSNFSYLSHKGTNYDTL